MLELILVGTIGVGAFAIWNGMSTYNRLMSLDERCTTAFADVDALLKHRHDLIPGLVQTVKGVVGQENRFLDTIVYAITETAHASNADTRLEAEQNLGNTINNVISEISKIPEMKTSSHFVDLRNSFKDVENRITAARRYYNNTVEEHNSTLRQFPANIIGAKFRLDKRDAYNLGVERIFKDEAVQMQF